MSLSLLVGGVATAQAPAPAASVRQRCGERGLDAQSTRLLVGAVERAARRGLPAGSVADKVLEGLAKNVAPARIAQAADEVAERLDGARAALEAADLQLGPTERRAALERLAVAIHLSDREAVLALARESRGAGAAELTRAAYELGELRRRGVGAEALPALSALARARMGDDLGRLARLLDEYRAEGGEDAPAFFEEVRSRAEQHLGLDDLVDPFGDGPDPLRRTAPPPGRSRPDRAGPKSSKPHPAEQPALEKPGRSGSAPGLDVESPGRKKKDCVINKNKVECK